MSRFTLYAMTLSMALLTGCARLKLSPPSASADNIQAARTANLPPLSVGEFSLAAGLPKSLDLSVSIRGSTLYSPYQDSLAKYLQETLRAELTGAGLLDPASATMVSGQLMQNTVEAGADRGNATLGARFKLVREGQTVYDKTLTASDNWPSSFIGAVAIPEAVNRYTSLYRKLVNQLLKDSEFIQATKRASP
ncbi:hypothetical protein [Variovorax terrae]|uniref:Lipoprotein n=1 Tax=Variovorax terrae TaxID=2923278 RepID=A0A9X2AQS2_9BURK|nr:hypothetical protein [Variovorax terrae]MCJ0763506.1 hypothetical protein [Variovorax terrae]